MKQRKPAWKREKHKRKRQAFTEAHGMTPEEWLEGWHAANDGHAAPYHTVEALHIYYEVQLLLLYDTLPQSCAKKESVVE